ncbi:MAG: DUF433 domain-containing protein [Nitrospiraceae bacterium]|nr:MAG: DUF433 domain-containing protein [Nitrospiraceae bacterium]
MTIKTEHAHIESIGGIQGGRPVIKGTRTPVRSIVVYHRMGFIPEEIQIKLPHLKLAQVYDALSYYYDYKEEIDHDIDSDSEDRIKQEMSL